MRNATIVAVGRHYGLTIATCVPADPERRGGSEATIRIAKADLVPTDHNRRDAYGSFAELEHACAVFCERVNTREHRITRRAPAVMLAEERDPLHRLPAIARTVCFGETRKVSWQSTISVGGAPLLRPLDARRRTGVGAGRWRRARRRSRRQGRGTARDRAAWADDAGPPEHR